MNLVDITLNFAVCTWALPWSNMKNKLSVILIHRNDAISQWISYLHNDFVIIKGFASTQNSALDKNTWLTIKNHDWSLYMSLPACKVWLYDTIGEMGLAPPLRLFLLTADLNRWVQWQERIYASLRPAPRALFKPPPPPQAAAFSGSTPKPLFTVMKSERDSIDHLGLPPSSDSAFSALSCSPFSIFYLSGLVRSQ